MHLVILKAISQSIIIITEWISACIDTTYKLSLSEILNVITAQNGLIKLPNFCFDFFSDLMTMVERILRTQIQLH
jgi:hypothetical protein